MTSSGLCNHGDTHQLQKSRCFRNEETHNGRRCSGLPLAAMAAPEGICARRGGTSAGEQISSLARCEQHEGRTSQEATVEPQTAVALMALSHVCGSAAGTGGHALACFDGHRASSCPIGRRPLARAFLLVDHFDNICAVKAVHFCARASPSTHVWEAYFSSVNHEATPPASLNAAMFSQHGYSFAPIIQTARARQT